MTATNTHLVLVPSFNTGPVLEQVVRQISAVWPHVLVVIDGSTDGSDAAVCRAASENQALQVVTRPANGGKGAAVLTGLETALAAGFTHVLVMDADGQHPVDHIARFMNASVCNPDAMILGKPIFDASVPLERLQGRKLSIGLVHFETLHGGVADPLFGFRVYPAAPLRNLLAGTRWARRYDFDPEVAVRLFWKGIRPINIPAPCRYFSKADGGVSHFHYVRDNVRMVWLHTRLITEFLLFRLPRTLILSRRWRRLRQPAVTEPI